MKKVIALTLALTAPAAHSAIGVQGLIDKTVATGDISYGVQALARCSALFYVVGNYVPEFKAHGDKMLSWAHAGHMKKYDKPLPESMVVRYATSYNNAMLQSQDETGDLWPEGGATANDLQTCKAFLSHVES